MNQAQTDTAPKTAPTMKQFFYYISCQRERPLDQLAKIIPSNKSKRCKTCVDNANAAKRLINRA